MFDFFFNDLYIFLGENVPIFIHTFKKKTLKCGYAAKWVEILIVPEQAQHKFQFILFSGCAHFCTQLWICALCFNRNKWKLYLKIII